MIEALTSMPPALFPAPDHDHRHCASAVIAHAKAHCTARARRPTPRCGAVGKAPGAAVAALKASLRAAGFARKDALIEIAGVCPHCRER